MPRYAAVGEGTALETAHVRVGDDGRIVRVVVEGHRRLKHLRGLKQGARLRRVVGRFDESIARELDVCLAEQRPASGIAVARTRRGEVVLDYRLEPEGEASTGKLTLIVSARSSTRIPVPEGDERSMMRALSEVASRLNREVSADDVARSILPLVVSFAGASTGAVFRLRSDGRADVLSAFGPTRRRGFPYAPLDLTDARLAALARKPGLVRMDASERRGMTPALTNLCPRGWSSLVLAPAFAGNSAQGLVMVAGTEGVAAHEDQARFLQVVADMVGLLLGFVTISTQSEAGERVLDAAGAVARAVSGSLDLERTFAEIASSAARIMGNCSCLLLEQRSQVETLVVVAASDSEDSCLLGTSLVFEGSDQTQSVLRTNRSIVVEDLNWGVHTPPEARDRLRFRSALFVPIRAQDGLIGSLLLYSAERRENYSEGDVARAEMVAEQAASAIWNARLFRSLSESEERSRTLLERITRLREEQRRQLADVIHDDIVQTAAAALYESEALRDRIPPEALIDADRVASLLRTTISEARGVIRDLRPPALAGLDLRGALHLLADRLADEMAWDLSLNVAPVPPLRQDVASALYVVAREALNNVKHHAQASRVTVSLEDGGESRPHVVCLDVTDNGVGFDVTSCDRLNHFGLSMMEEHAALLGGVVAVDSRTGGGTSVRAVIPLSDGADTTGIEDRR